MLRRLLWAAELANQGRATLLTGTAVQPLVTLSGDELQVSPQIQTRTMRILASTILPVCDGAVFFADSDDYVPLWPSGTANRRRDNSCCRKRVLVWLFNRFKTAY
jgi:hypothetical protein